MFIDGVINKTLVICSSIREFSRWNCKVILNPLLTSTPNLPVEYNQDIDMLYLTYTLRPLTMDRHTEKIRIRAKGTVEAFDLAGNGTRQEL